tara:strand:+ start:27162 stop:27689 length:528 start_codon:yes stop_codon:yes gene_type:complete
MALRAHSAPTDDPNRANQEASALIVGVSKWLGFLAGLAMIVAVALIPPAADLQAIRHQRDRVLAMEQTDLARIANYKALITAIDEKDPDTIRLVLASQLQLVPRGKTALVAPGAPDDPRLFEILEPIPTPMPADTAPVAPSALTRMATTDLGRLVLLSIAVVAILWGITGPARPD